MKEVRNLNWMKNQKELTLQRENLTCGVYYLMMQSPDNLVIGTSKFVIID
jgi:hypothetical protein